MNNVKQMNHNCNNKFHSISIINSSNKVSIRLMTIFFFSKGIQKKTEIWFVGKKMVSTYLLMGSYWEKFDYFPTFFLSSNFLFVKGLIRRFIFFGRTSLQMRFLSKSRMPKKSQLRTKWSICKIWLGQLSLIVIHAHLRMTSHTLLEKLKIYFWHWALGLRGY